MLKIPLENIYKLLNLLEDNIAEILDKNSILTNKINHRIKSFPLVVCIIKAIQSKKDDVYYIHLIDLIKCQLVGRKIITSMEYTYNSEGKRFLIWCNNKLKLTYRVNYKHGLIYQNLIYKRTPEPLVINDKSNHYLINEKYYSKEPQVEESIRFDIFITPFLIKKQGRSAYEQWMVDYIAKLLLLVFILSSSVEDLVSVSSTKDYIEDLYSMTNIITNEINDMVNTYPLID